MPRLYIGNLPYSTNEQEVIDAFAALGVVATSVHLPKDRETGQARGFGFAEVSSNPQEAIAVLNGAKVLGRVLRVDVAEERPQRSGGGGGGGGRPSGGGGGGWKDDHRGDRGDRRGHRRD